MANWKRLLTADDLGALGGDTHMGNTDLSISDARTHALGRNPFIIRNGSNPLGDILTLHGVDGDGTDMEVTLRGNVNLKPDVGNETALKLYNTSSKFTSLKNSTSSNVDINLTLPVANPANGRFLRHSSGGQLEWAQVTQSPDTHIGSTDFTISTPTIRSIDGDGTLSLGTALVTATNLTIEPASGASTLVLKHSAGGSISLVSAALNPGDSHSYTLVKPSLPGYDMGLVLAENGGSANHVIAPKAIRELLDFSTEATAAGYQSIASYIADESSTGGVDFIVDANNLAESRKLSLNDIGGYLVVQMVNANIANGIGDEGTYTTLGADNELGEPADLNGDGEVSTADLLEFLTAFGQTDSDTIDSNATYTLRKIGINALGSTTDFGSVSVGGRKKLEFLNDDVTVTEGQLDVGVNAGDDEITISSSSFFNMTALPAKKLRFTNDDANDDGGVTVLPSSAGGQLFLEAKIEVFSSTDSQVGNTAYAVIGEFDNSQPLPSNGEVKIYAGNGATSQFTVTSNWLLTNVGVNWSSNLVSKIKFSYHVRASDVLISGVKLDNLTARLTGS